jgi:hypothetical protein
VANFTLSLLQEEGAMTDPEATAVVCLFIAGALSLLAAAICAIIAVVPRSGWRAELRDLQIELSSGSLTGQRRVELLREMLDDQRTTNEWKAALMRSSYLLLALGVLIVLAEAVVGALAIR